MPRAKRRLGQHFLSDPGILERIADALEATRDDTVLEIGPGPGGLTEALAARAGKVVAIEKDADLVPRAAASGCPARRSSRPTRWRPTGTRSPGPALLVAGNIPYNITSPLIDKALAPPRPRRIVFLVQKEVADRVGAAAGKRGVRGAERRGPGGRAGGAAVHGAGRRVPSRGRKVDSAVLRLTPLAEPLVADGEVEPFRRLVVGLFGFRRKQMGRGLRELTGWDAGAGATRRSARAGIEPSVRPETVARRNGSSALLRALVDGGWQRAVGL